MENCTIYSHHPDFEKVVEIVRSKLPKAKVDFNDGGIQKSLIATIKGGLFGKTKTLKINYRQRQNPSYQLDKVECGLTQNLAGMVNFIQSVPAKNEELRNKFLIKVMSANCEMAFMAEPQITDEFETVLRKIVHELEGFIFATPNAFFNKSNSQYFGDQDFNLVLDTEGNCEVQDIDVKVDTKYYDQPAEEYTDDQIQRKGQSESFLESNGVKTNKNLPCIASAEHTQLRDIKEVIERTYALVVIAAKGEGAPQENLAKLVEARKINGFSPNEQIIFDAETLNDQQKANALWRYESLYTMLWAMNLMPELKYPNEICDVQTIVGKVVRTTRADFEASAQLRSTAEILDELDKTFRMNWACEDARIKGEEVTGNIHPSIIYERHYALNWLINYQNQDWDDVKTNT